MGLSLLVNAETGKVLTVPELSLADALTLALGYPDDDDYARSRKHHTRATESQGYSDPRFRGPRLVCAC